MGEADRTICLSSEDGGELFFRVSSEAYDALAEDAEKKRASYLRAYLRTHDLPHFDLLVQALTALQQIISTFDGDGGITCENFLFHALRDRSEGGPFDEIFPVLEFLEKTESLLWGEFTDSIMRHARPLKITEE